MTRDGSSAAPWVGVAAVAVGGLLAAGWWFQGPGSVAPTTPIDDTPSVAVPYGIHDGPIPGFPDFRTGGALKVQHQPLHTVAPRATLPEVDYDTVGDRFVLTHEPLPNPRNAARIMTIVRAPLPFPVDADDQLFRPQDMEVELDGEVVPFSRRPAPRARGTTWRINGSDLIVTHPDLPGPEALTLRYTGVQQRLDRHDPAKSGLAPAQFVRTELTLGRHTRSGLLLVAPTTLEWDLTVPNGAAQFEGFVAMEPPPLQQATRDGADLELIVVAEGADTVVGTQPVEPTTSAFQRWRVDLSRWAGQSVTLRMSATPRADASYDWVFVGSPTVWGPPEHDVRRVVVVGLDTTRPDHLSFNGYRRPTTPELDAFARSGIVFERTWAPAPRTRPSFRSATTGRRPLDAVGAQNIGAVFQERGFATAGFVANPHLQPHFDFSDGFDTWLFDGKADAEEQVDRALTWLDAHQDRDSYLFLHIMDPHMIYDAPEPYRNRFVDDPDPSLPARMTRRDVLARMKSGTLTERQQVELEALHDGELAYTSHHLGRLFDHLDKMPGRSLVVVHTDHGEEFWEHEGFEHNHTLYDEVTRAALVVRPRGGLTEGARISAPATLADIGPTLFDLFGIEDPPPLDGRSLVPLMADPDTTWPPRSLPIAHVQYGHERWGVVWQDHKYILHTGSGDEELYDLAADPGELVNIAAERPLDPLRAQLALSHSILVGPGWRIRVQIRPRKRPEAVRIQLPSEAVEAGVLDPEAVTEHRANIEWGDRPKKTEADVGTVVLADDRRSMLYTPGPSPLGGVLYVVFAEPADPHKASVEVEGARIEAGKAPLGPRFAVPGGAIVLDPGTVVVPPATEAERMGLVPAPTASGELEQHLCKLGYLAGCDQEDAGP